MKRKESGQSLAEIALLLPVFLLAVMMIADIGRAVFYYGVVYNAAREGARAGIINSTPTTVASTDVANAARHLANGILNGLNENDCPASTNGKEKIKSRVYPVAVTYSNAYSAIEVTVCYEFKAATPFLGRLTGSPENNIFLRSQATMRLEQQN